jgi:hypothetical protein
VWVWVERQASLSVEINSWSDCGGRLWGANDWGKVRAWVGVVEIFSLQHTNPGPVQSIAARSPNLDPPPPPPPPQKADDCKGTEPEKAVELFEKVVKLESERGTKLHLSQFGFSYQPMWPFYLLAPLLPCPI